MNTNKGIKLIQNVLYVPSSCENLLSVAQLVEKGYVLNFGCDGCLILDTFGNEVFKVALKDKSYRLNLLDSEQALRNKVESISQLWHKRLGHSSYGAMKNTNALVNDLPLMDDVNADESAKWDWSKEELLVNDDEPRFEEENEERNVENNNDEDDNDEDNEEDDDLFQETIIADLEDGDSVREERFLSEIYERCNVALSDPICVQEALMKKEWKEAMDVEVMQCSRGIFISQEKYIKDLLKKFNLDECKPMPTPMSQGEKYKKEDGTPKVNPTLYRSMIGSLLYVCSTRPDIMHATCVLSRYMQAPSQNHFVGAKRILRYLKGTQDFGV